jgi:hypothetical protein
MAGLIPWGSGPLKCGPDAELGFVAGDELKGTGKTGFADRYLLGFCTSKVVAADVVTALTIVQQRAFLASHTVDVRLDGNPSGANLTSLEEDNPFHPLQKVTGDKLLVHHGRNLFEKDFPGLADSATGLAQAFAAAATYNLKWTLLISLGQMEYIEEDEELFGIGPDQLDRLSLTVRVNGDYPKSVSADLTYSELSVSFYSLRGPAKGRRIGLPPQLRRFTPATTKQSVTTNRGVPLLMLDLKQPLASYAKGQLTVEVGGQVVTRPPQTAEDINTNYELNPDVGTVEKTIKSLYTPIYILPDTRFAAMRSGSIIARQETLLEAWDAELLSLPSPLAAQWVLYLRKCAMNLPEGSVCHYVNTARLYEKNAEPRLLSAGGVTGFLESEPEAKLYPSVKIGQDGKVGLVVPPEYLGPAAQKWADGKSEGTAAGEAKAESAVFEVAEWLPGACEDEVKGFPRAAGGGGAKTFVFTFAERLVAAYGLAELERRAKLAG